MVHERVQAISTVVKFGNEFHNGWGAARSAGFGRDEHNIFPAGLSGYRGYTIYRYDIELHVVDVKWMAEYGGAGDLPYLRIIERHLILIII